MADERPMPDTQVPDTQEDFENLSQTNATERSDSQTAWDVNRKRTYDVYQQFDVESYRQSHRLAEKLDNIAVQALQNSVETANLAGKQALRHADVAADALWTDELNPTMHGAEAVMAGQAPVNSQLSSTASLDAVYTNLTAQLGTMTTQVVGLAQAIMQSNVAITNTNAAMVALLAQLVQNAKQGGATPTA